LYRAARAGILWGMRRTVLVALLLSLTFRPPLALPDRQIPLSEAAAALLAQMTPDERVGQLFLVTFHGSAPRPDDPIFDLIRSGHISGVLLQAQSDNFVDAPNTLQAAQSLIASLQTTAYEASLQLPPGESESSTPTPVGYVPLFIALSQEGGGTPYSEILSGLSEIPSEMAIGATWDPSLSGAVGEVVGSELEALGINLLLGPSLDVLEDPRPEGPGDLGVRTFGGDPFWVSLMGRAYIEGVHSGSRGRVAVVAKHFPGHGGSDRPLDEEVATVRKSLEELERIELAPFFAVTGAAPGEDPAVTDALLRAHIRYQGFQDNIRATTRPVSLDPQAFAEIMALEPLATWRAGGGVTISDSLGSRAIRRFYDPREVTFRGHLVARDAFLAGNDLLLLSSFQSTGDPDEATTIRATLAFFAQKYEEDSLFAQRVDEAVLRILELKMRLYGQTFSLEDVLPEEGSLDLIGGSGVAEQVARAGATLISPSAGEVEERLGAPPRLGERIVFLTDVRMAAQCSTCTSTPGIGLDALERTILRLYGPGAAGQVGGWTMVSYSLADLAAYLGQPPPPSLGIPISSAEEVGDALESASWLVFSILGSNSDAYGSDALKLLLDRRPDLAQRTRVVVFAFGVPYDLDSTDLSKVDVYYGLYSKESAFVEVAARLLFQELSPPGASPVSIPGIGYDLLTATSPDPDQVISLTVTSPEAGASQATPEAGYIVGDVIQVETGVIVDHNEHPVPDGTVVEFSLSYQAEIIAPMILRSTTASGVAQVEVALERLGLFEITATSDPARSSAILQLNVQEGVPAYVTVIAPTPIPTEEPPATETPAPSTPAPGSEEVSAGETPDVGFAHFLLGMTGIGAVVAASWRLARRQVDDPQGWIRWLLASAIGGLVGYNYLAMGLPGSRTLLQFLGPLSGAMLGILGAIVGLIAARMWQWRSTR
jgi:beta-N-acetylhexosaminidase